jgi:predicted phage-related endonuclease
LAVTGDNITIHEDVIQGTEEWHALRCGILTASEMRLILTPATLKPAKNNEASSHLYELLAQRITKYVEPRYVSDDMLRGREDELVARELYHKHYAPVDQVGFITSDELGFTIGYSPDGLVGDDGLIECKSRRQKFQIETMISCVVPRENMIQIQTGLLVTGRAWCDYISYCGGLPMVVIRVYPDGKIIEAITDAAMQFEELLQGRYNDYLKIHNSGIWRVETERRIEQEMYL